MSKSLGNIISITEAVNKYSGQVVRLALLSAHYSQPLDWNDELLNSQKSILEISEEEILQKIKDRNTARDNKNYQLADEIRNELLDKGILIEDKDDKTTWKIK